MLFPLTEYRHDMPPSPLYLGGIEASSYTTFKRSSGIRPCWTPHRRRADLVRPLLCLRKSEEPLIALTERIRQEPISQRGIAVTAEETRKQLLEGPRGFGKRAVEPQHDIKAGAVPLCRDTGNPLYPEQRR